jgi:hypothetical protein
MFRPLWPNSGRGIIASNYSAVVGIFTVNRLTAGNKDNSKFGTIKFWHLLIYIFFLVRPTDRP